MNSNYRNTTDYIIERQDLTCPKCCTIIQIVDSTTNGQIFYIKQKEKSISEFGEADPEIIVKQAEVFVHKFMEFRQDLFFNLKKRLIPQKIPIWMSKDTNNFFEIDDFFENIDETVTQKTLFLFYYKIFLFYDFVYDKE